MLDNPIRGSIYQDGARARGAQPSPWPRRDIAIASLREEVSSHWDMARENEVTAVIAVLDWHGPWMHWRQVFDPMHIGDRFEGQGCRSCNWMSPNECPTVRAVCDALRIPA